MRLFVAISLFILLLGCITQLAPGQEQPLPQNQTPSAQETRPAQCENTCGAGEMLGAFPECECLAFCPDTCDDGNPCTSERCGADTENKCSYEALNGQKKGCEDDKVNCLERSCVEGECIEIDFTGTIECNPEQPQAPPEQPPVQQEDAVNMTNGTQTPPLQYYEQWESLGRVIEPRGKSPEAFINPYREVELFWLQNGKVEFALSPNGQDEWLYLGTSHYVHPKEPGGKDTYEAIRSFDMYKVNNTHMRMLIDGSDIKGQKAQTYSLISKNNGYTWQPEIGIRLRTLNWTTGVNNNSGKRPAVVDLGYGMFRMYYEDNESNIKSAISYDNGFVWDRENITCINGPAEAPSVVRLANGTYRMFYSVPKEKVREKYLQLGLRSALSEDGVTFEEEYDKRVAVPDKRYLIMQGDRVALLQNGSIVLKYTSGPEPVREMQERGEIALAVTSALRVLPNRTYQLLFLFPEDIDYASWDYTGIKSALSADGLVWNEEQGYRLIATDPSYDLTDPEVLALPDNRTIMYYAVDRGDYSDYTIYAAEQKISYR